MNTLQTSQRQFFNFAEALHFLALLSSDVDLSRPAPNYAMFSKSKGIVAGCNFPHMCHLIRDTFGIKVIPEGCIESISGYIFTFEGGYLEETKPEERKELSLKSKADLLAMAKEKGLDVTNAMKKEDILLSLIAA